MKLPAPLTRLFVLTPIFLSTGIAIPTARAACGDPAAGVGGGLNCGSSPVTLPVAIGRIVNLLLFIIGVVAVIMIVIGGLRYVLSGGDPKNTTAAKDTVLYAVIGIVVALLAYAIVSFVLNQFK